jgi:hypothetical protein
MQKKTADGVAAHIRQKQGAYRPQQHVQMIHFVDVLLKDIFEMGREFPWKKPDKCPCCGNWKVWGHGFVSAFFHGFCCALWLKRYRCPACGCVIRMRPASHFSRFQSSRHTIRSTLLYRINAGRWPKDSCKSRQRHWLKNLKRQKTAWLHWKAELSQAFDLLLDQGRVPVTSAI